MYVAFFRTSNENQENAFQTILSNFEAFYLLMFTFFPLHFAASLSYGTEAFLYRMKAEIE